MCGKFSQAFIGLFLLPLLGMPLAHGVDLTATDPATGRPLPIDRPVPLPRIETSMHVAMDVLVDGRPLRTVHHQGRTYLPVPRIGAEYEIRVWNHGSRRIVAMVSVDGLSVLNGRRASDRDPGYIVDPGSYVIIKGWRRDLDTVAAFRFTERGKTYADRVGMPENVGMIQVVAVEEQRPRSRPRPWREDFAGARSKVQSHEGASIGTEYGRTIDSGAYYVPFIRSHNRRTVTLYYDTVQALRDAGIPVDRPRPLPIGE